ncbi:hypothetical protein [Clostridium sp. C2-6-12]|uniref:hypothetical protein n=1 Tax=Clostridium sp. C2-6-12 TaxID=2698832 RepID=UPI00137080C2|nr:hypothetical protein [Clostridium sp. C2-6-12]
MVKNIYSEIVSAYHGLRNLLGNTFREENVITKTAKDYKDLSEVLNDYKRLSILAKEENEYVYKKLISTVYYIRNLLKEDIDYKEYVKNTIGAEVVFTSQKEIDQLIKVIKDKFMKMGIEYSKEEIQSKFYNLNIDMCELEEYMNKELNRQTKIAEDYLDLKFNAAVGIKFIEDENIPYKYRLSIDKNGYILNVNKGLIKGYLNETSLKYAISHEICGHAFQLYSWKNGILSGNINEVCGCEEDYGTEIFQLEGVGESICYFVFRNEIDSKMEIELLLDYLHHLVQNNSYILFNNGENLSEVVNYYKTNYILAEPEEIEKRIKLSKGDSFYKANLYVYGSSLSTFKNISDDLTEEKRKIFFREMYTSPMCYDEIIKYYKMLNMTEGGF